MCSVRCTARMATASAHLARSRPFGLALLLLPVYPHEQRCANDKHTTPAQRCEAVPEDHGREENADHLAPAHKMVTDNIKRDIAQYESMSL